jgi:hypothetical protein
VGVALGDEGNGTLMLFASEERSGTGIPYDLTLATLLGGSDNANFSRGIAPRAVDIDADGDADLVVGDEGYDGGRGAVQIFPQP